MGDFSDDCQNDGSDDGGEEGLQDEGAEDQYCEGEQEKSDLSPGWVFQEFLAFLHGMSAPMVGLDAKVSVMG